MDSRLVDSHKLHFHPARVAQWLEGKDDWESAKRIYPLYVEISPVGACNHRCTFCAVDYIGYKAVRLDTHRILPRLSEMGSLGVRSVMFAGEGEPLLHTDIDAMVIASRAAGMDVAFTTNGVLLDRLGTLEECSWVKVSVNAGRKETYAKIHRTDEKDWDRVWKNIRDAVKRKGGCDIGVQMVALPENEGEWRDLEATAMDAGVDYVVIKPYSQHKKSITRKYDGYKPIQVMHGPRLVLREDSINTESLEYNKCNATPFFWAYVMSSGDVYSCSAYLLDDRFKLGNLHSQSFKEIWEGERRRSNWTLLGTSLDISECRVNCRMDKANRYLADFDKIKNITFI